MSLSSIPSMKISGRQAQQLVQLGCFIFVCNVIANYAFRQATQVTPTRSTAALEDTTIEQAVPPVSERVVRAPFYLKTHKTGSSTIAHHLLQFARLHNLSTLRAPSNIFINTPNASPHRWDAIVAHHVVFNLTVIRSYMRREPDLILTSIRLPLQRQVSWFQQQNKMFANMSCVPRNDTLLAHFDAWFPKRVAPQHAQLQEATSKETLLGDIEKILDQFDFVFVKERLKESFECFCEKTGIRLCHDKLPLVKKNVRGGSCVEEQLLKHRAAELLEGSERDLLLYEAALNKMQCRPSDWCRCPVK